MARREGNRRTGAVTNYRVGFEPPWTERGSLRHPADFPSQPRNLVTPASRAPAHYAPGPPPIPEEVKRTERFAGFPPQVVTLLKGLEKLFQRPISTMERPFDRWRVDQVTLTNVTTTWMDQFMPAAAGQQRFLQGRRAVIIVNHDDTNNIWIRHADQALPAGGYVAAEGSITLPLGESCKVFGQSAGATSLVSFYQFA
jgi:hypothetical protein